MAFALLILVYSCASIGSPDGGPYDETPPKFVAANPVPGATNSKSKKIILEFDENIKLEKASEKVVVSPPQLKQPEIKSNGRKVTVKLQDTLMRNTTYTIDFSDAIVDNNEGNPLGNFSYTFSTGEVIDTLEISGNVLNAYNLEPVKGIQVGIHSNLSDTAFTKLPLERVAMTDSRGHFSIKGIAPGSYHVYALKDGNQNYRYDSPTEVIAFSDSVYIPRCKADLRQDTIWADSLTIDTIKTVAFTHFYPDSIILRSFKALNKRQYLKDQTRDRLNHFILTFSAEQDTLPALRGLNFEADGAFIIENTPGNDSICYWIKDSLLAEQDTLQIEMKYLGTDTLDRLVPTIDTLFVANKHNRAQRAKFKKQEEEKAEKELEKQRKKLGRERADSIAAAKKAEPKFLSVKIDAPSSFDINDNVYFSFEEPIVSIDTSAIHLEVKVDSLYHDEPFIFRADTAEYRKYKLMAAWSPEKEYRLSVDSAAFIGLYGLHTDKQREQTMTVRKLEDYGTILLNIKGVEGPAIVQLLDSSEKILRQEKVKDGHADFYFLKPETKYYIRMFIDKNNNGKWDTGSYDENLEPEEMYYFPKVWTMKANFDFEETWNPADTPLTRQKPDEIKKQKPEEAKKIKSRNAERERKLGRK